jgi:hypothetical protein
MLWCLLMTLALMFIGGVISAVLVAYFDQLFPLPVAITGGVIGAVVGTVVGGFHGLWAQRHQEIDRVFPYIWTGINGSLGMIGMAICIVLVTMLFDFKEIIAPGRAALFGLLYGIICSTIILLCEYIAMQRHVYRIWPWLSVRWMAWLLWWVGIIYFICGLSGMD